ncbi:MAG: hypothetical protein FD151_1566, partial [bacterium]
MLSEKTGGFKSPPFKSKQGGKPQAGKPLDTNRLIRYFHATAFPRLVAKARIITNEEES